MRADVKTSAAIPRLRAMPGTVATRVVVSQPLPRVWEALLLYEEIEAPPPWLLRLLLPTPVRVEGTSEEGNVVRCAYDRGYLIKRLVHVEECRLYEFEVVEQQLELGGGVLLAGGSYRLREAPGGATELSVETRYVGARRPRWLWEPAERWVCNAFHRYLLGIIAQRAEAA